MVLTAYHLLSNFQLTYCYYCLLLPYTAGTLGHEKIDFNKIFEHESRVVIYRNYCVGWFRFGFEWDPKGLMYV